MIGTKFYKNNLNTQEELNAYLECSSWANANDALLEDKGEFYEVVDRELGVIKEEVVRRAGSVFAKKRDAVRYVKVSDGNTYGFDTANEDITNFMAGWKRAELTGSTFYKVYLSPTVKTLVYLKVEDFATVSNAVSQSQFDDYKWYETIKAQILACTTKAELESIEIK